MAELGNTLSRARRARGISLEDAERDTHVSRRYLQALESEDFSAFPAPVYARGFLRTYSRYLGLNPEELLRIFPNGNLTVDLAPLPQVSRPPSQVINVNWLVAGVVMLFLLGAGLLLWRGGGDPAGIDGLAAARASTQVVPNQPQTTIGPPAARDNNAPVQGKPIGPIRPGVLPDFVGADMPSALALLRDNDMNFVIVEVQHATTPRGLVISQTPAPGSRSADDTAVTLFVSRGPAQ
jgi:transcriptional regulator with XRE-family HTH domain